MSSLKQAPCRQKQDSRGAAAEEGASKPPPPVVKMGDVLEGTVQSVMHYGAFVDLKGGRVGLLHLREFSAQHIDSEKLADVLKIGTKLKVSSRMNPSPPPFP